MVKRFAYIVLLLIFAYRLSFAGMAKDNHMHAAILRPTVSFLSDTITTKKTKQQLEEEKNKIKEIAKAKRQAKPEKIDAEGAAKPKAKRERRPEGLERPPEIPRRNGN